MDKKTNSEVNEKVPLFGSWTKWYVFVLVVLAALIIGFHYFTQYFS